MHNTYSYFSFRVKILKIISESTEAKDLGSEKYFCCSGLNHCGVGSFIRHLISDLRNAAILIKLKLEVGRDYHTIQ